MKSRMTAAEFSRQFPNEAACAAYIERERWGGEPACPRCVHGKVWRISGAMGFKCGGCRKRFSLRTGSAMEHSKIPLRTWLLAICLMTAPTRPRGTILSWVLALYMASDARLELSCGEFAEKLEITQKTAWTLASRIRRACGGAAAGIDGAARMAERSIEPLAETFAEAAAKVVRTLAPEEARALGPMPKPKRRPRSKPKAAPAAEGAFSGQAARSMPPAGGSRAPSPDDVGRGLRRRGAGDGREPAGAPDGAGAFRPDPRGRGPEAPAAGPGSAARPETSDIDVEAGGGP